ncbi:MAG: beta-ketoacyl synthase N-terminal-like domain-containing protein, partial [Trebonia sp.]
MTSCPHPTDAAELRDWMISRVAEIAGVPAPDIDPAAPFDSYGLGSAQAVSLSGELEERLGRTLTPTLLYEHPTIDQLAAALTGTALAGTARAAKAGPAPEAAADEVTLCLTGMACRFPGGADTPGLFWQNLMNGVDASSPLPEDRWEAVLPVSDDPDEPGAVYTTRGAFLHDVAGFDVRFFGISPREAARMEPQQRLLLEVTWEALENAGLAADQLRGSRTGVFIGMMAESQYGSLQLDAQGRSGLDDPYFGLGIASSVAAGRVSYFYDLRGPSLVVDTACSSSLVALHLAAQSIRNGDCDTAIVGGVSAITHPDSIRQACKMRMLARDGRCKTFDGAADGFVLGEGCGVVILERARRAAELGRRPLAILRGSATNSDGMSNGLTAPNGGAQVAVITQALARAGLRPADVDYVEAHGSGTLLGDTIEVTALQQALGSGRDASRPVVIGAVKTNVGHLTGAAGIAGLIKAILALRHGQVPANLHLATPNPGIDWDAAPTLLPAAAMPWPEAGTGVAGVSSFGWSGTNAHVILERPAPAQPDPAGAGADGWHLLPLSATTATAIGAVAGNLAERLRADPEISAADAARTLQEGRSALRVRAAVVCRDRDDAIGELGEVGQRIGVRTVAAGHRPRVSFLFPGTGEQYAGMAGGLYQTEPVFRDAVDRCAAAAGVHGVDLTDAF